MDKKKRWCSRRIVNICNRYIISWDTLCLFVFKSRRDPWFLFIKKKLRWLWENLCLSLSKSLSILVSSLIQSKVQTREESSKADVWIILDEMSLLVVDTATWISSNINKTREMKRKDVEVRLSWNAAFMTTCGGRKSPNVFLWTSLCLLNVNDVPGGLPIQSLTDGSSSI